MLRLSRVSIVSSLLAAAIASAAAQDTARVKPAPDSAKPRFVDPVVVTSAAPNGPTSAALPEFDARRAKGTGRFLTADELRREDDRAFVDVLRSRMPGLMFEVAVDGTHAYNATQTPPGGLNRASRNAGGKCYLQVVVDGISIYQMDTGSGVAQTPPDISEFLTRSLDGVEFYSVPSRTPAELRGPGAICGTLVVWSRRK